MSLFFLVFSDWFVKTEWSLRDHGWTIESNKLSIYRSTKHNRPFVVRENENGTSFNCYYYPYLHIWLSWRVSVCPSNLFHFHFDMRHKTSDTLDDINAFYSELYTLLVYIRMSWRARWWHSVSACCALQHTQTNKCNENVWLCVARNWKNHSAHEFTEVFMDKISAEHRLSRRWIAGWTFNSNTLVTSRTFRIEISTHFRAEFLLRMEGRHSEI